MTENNNDYINRINKAIDYINENISEELNLENVAKASYFSKYHFNRIFKSITGETVSDYIKRIRLEKSAHILGVMKNSITEIAIECGFNSSEQFSREFKNYFGFSPSEIKKIKRENSENGIAESMEKITAKRKFCNHKLDKQFMENLKSMESEIINCEKIDMYYKRYTGRYGIELQKFIIEFMDEIKEYIDINSLKTNFCGIIYDNPRISDDDKCRFDICISKKSIKEVKSFKDIYGEITIQSGKYAKFKYKGTSEEVGNGYAWIYGIWFPNSGYEPDDRLGHHIYKKFNGYGEEFECDMYIPIRKLK